MFRLSCTLLLGIAIGTAEGESPPSVAELVQQLSHPRFGVREAAQKALLERGEKIAPALEELLKTADTETDMRLKRILFDLVGYKQTILKGLGKLGSKDQRTLDAVPAVLCREVESLQPRSGNFLLSILTQQTHALKYPALKTFVATWDSATPDQIEFYLKSCVALKTAHRPKFPGKVGALISFEAQIRDGWAGWPPTDKKLNFVTRSQRYLDGKPYDLPFEYPYPFATIGWYRLGELAVGKHSIHAVMEYEFTQGGQKRKGEIRSSDSTFEIVPADAPDTLIAQKSPAPKKKVQSVFRICENERRAIESAYRLPEIPNLLDRWQPQISWTDNRKDWYGLTCPHWRLAESLEVDLCFDVEIRDVKSGATYACDPLVVVRGKSGGGYISPRNPREFAKSREGPVSVEVLLKPSRAMALTDERIANYYPEAMTFQDLRMIIIPPTASKPVAK